MYNPYISALNSFTEVTVNNLKCHTYAYRATANSNMNSDVSQFSYVISVHFIPRLFTLALHDKVTEVLGSVIAEIIFRIMMAKWELCVL
jgi:hypothetical protein